MAKRYRKKRRKSFRSFKRHRKSLNQLVGDRL